MVTSAGGTISGSFEFTAFEAILTAEGDTIAGSRWVTVTGTFTDITRVEIP